MTSLNTAWYPSFATLGLHSSVSVVVRKTCEQVDAISKKETGKPGKRRGCRGRRYHGYLRPSFARELHVGPRDVQRQDPIADCHTLEFDLEHKLLGPLVEATHLLHPGLWYIADARMSYTATITCRAIAQAPACLFHASGRVILVYSMAIHGGKKQKRRFPDLMGTEPKP